MAFSAPLLLALPSLEETLNGQMHRQKPQKRSGSENHETGPGGREITDAEPTVAALRVELRAWEHTYNFVRPRQALG